MTATTATTTTLSPLHDDRHETTTTQLSLHNALSLSTEEASDAPHGHYRSPSPTPPPQEEPPRPPPPIGIGR